MKPTNYETEVRSRCGNAYAYREHEQKAKNYAKETEESSKIWLMLWELQHRQFPDGNQTAVIPI